MPTPLSPTEKSNFIAIVNAAPYPGGPAEAARLVDILNDYEDVVVAIGRQIDLFAGNNPYLLAVLGVLDDSKLQGVYIFVNKTVISTPLVNPVAIINSSYQDGVNLTTRGEVLGLTILGPSRINKITISSNVNLDNLYIGPGAAVDLFDSTASGSFVNNIWLPYIKSNPSTLNNTVFGSATGNISVDPGSYYGGPTGADSQLACATPVTAIGVQNITNVSIQIIWTPPVTAYLFINVFYRQKGSNVWLPVTDDTGYYDGQTGYTFTELKPITYYEIKVVVTCPNGGLSAPANISVKTLSDAQSDCCDGNNVIKRQWVIPTDFPAGPTITYQGLIGKQILFLSLDNNTLFEGKNYTFDNSTGIIDFTLSGGVFDGSIIDILFQ